MADPTGIPVRVALALCADVLSARAASLAGPPSRNARRHGQGRQGSPGRLREADDCRAAAAHARALSESRELVAPDIDAAVLGYLLAVCRHYTPALAELREELIATGWDRSRALALHADPLRDLVRSVLLAPR